MIIDQIEIKNIINMIKKNKMINRTLKIFKRKIIQDVRIHLLINKIMIEVNLVNIITRDQDLIKIDPLINPLILIKWN
jgi:hypothetical protein